jgi:hypothetical protein
MFTASTHTAFTPRSLVVSSFLYQGLLDLHGWLYSPNAGEKIGHLPADNFLDFVQAVTTDIVKASGNEAEELPYTLEIVPPSSPIPRA